MPAAAAFRPRRALRAVVCAVALAAGLQTVAGGGPATAQHAVAADAPGAAAAHVAAPTRAPVALRPAALPPKASKPALPAASSGVPADPPPYAPGGDDLLQWEDPPPAPATVHAAPAQATPARTPQRTAAGPVLPARPIAAERGDGWLVADFFGPSQPGAFVLVPAGRGVGFLAQDASGRWQDRTAALLPDAADRQACPRPGSPITADFNGDGRPDVYLPCGGRRAGEAHAQLLFLSRADGGYARAEAAVGFEASSAEAADVDGDGRLDIATTDTTWGAWRPLLLRGLGDGHFELQGL